jgi:hypothetical protein
VIVTTENSAPVANAGPDQSVPAGAPLATLDGSASSDVDGDPLTYAWSLAGAPYGSGATLSDPTAVMPSFMVDLPGTYVAQLIVNDGLLDSAPSPVIVTTENSAPVANAGLDQSVPAGALVTLDGSASSDTDGDTLTFVWSLSAVPPGSGAVLSDPTAVMPGFVADLPGTYVAQLIVNDGFVDGAPDSVTISIMDIPPLDPDGKKLELEDFIEAVAAQSVTVTGLVIWPTQATVVQFKNCGGLQEFQVGQRVKIIAWPNVDGSATAERITVNCGG